MNNNFYIAAPNVFNNNRIVFKNGKFEKALLKCGETRRSVENRLKEESANSGGMATLFEFYVDPAKIDNKRTSHFDTILFGHRQIANTWKSTIWKNMPACLMPTSSGETENGYGCEYMDFAPALNEWMKSSEVGGYLRAIETAEDQNAHCNALLLLIKKLLNENMPALVEKYTETKIDKPPVHLFNHQILGLRRISRMLENGARNIIAQLPCRWGKTMAFLDLFNNSSCKLMIVASYMKTVGNSYIKEASSYKDFEDIQIVDIDDCADFKYRGGKAMIVFPTTGDDETAVRRVKTLKRLDKQIQAGEDEVFLLNEEADYANHTMKSDCKFKQLAKLFGKMIVVSTTGTEAHKAAKLNAFGPVDGRIACNANDWNQFFV